MRTSRRSVALALAVCACVWAVGPLSCRSQDVRLDRCVVASATIETTGSVTLRGTAGQAAAGRIDGVAQEAWLGFWYLPSKMTVGIGDAPPLLPERLDADIFPNPAAGDLLIRIRLGEPASLRITATDATGRILMRREFCDVPDGALLPITHTELRAANGGPCIVFLRLETVSAAGIAPRVIVLPAVLLY